MDHTLSFHVCFLAEYILYLLSTYLLFLMKFRCICFYNNYHLDSILGLQLANSSYQVRCTHPDHNSSTALLGNNRSRFSILALIIPLYLVDLNIYPNHYNIVHMKMEVMRNHRQLFCQHPFHYKRTHNCANTKSLNLKNKQGFQQRYFNQGQIMNTKKLKEGIPHLAKRCRLLIFLETLSC